MMMYLHFIKKGLFKVYQHFYGGISDLLEIGDIINEKTLRFAF